MAQAGTAYLDIEARTDNMQSEILDALANIDGTVEVDALAVTDDAQAQIDAIDGGSTDVDVGAVTDEAQAQIDAVDGGSTEVEVTANTEQAQAQIDGLGGQIESMVGQAGDGSAALDGFAGSALGAGNMSGMAAAGGLAALGLGLGASISAAADAEVVWAKLDNILQTTGAGASISAEEIQALSAEVQGYSGMSDEAIGSSATLLLTFQGLSNEAAIANGTFERSVKATADIAALMGGDAAGAALRLGRAMDDPVRGMTALQRSGVSFTASQRETIQALAESGDMLGAQAALLDVVEGQVGGTAAAYGDTFAGSLDKAKESVGDLAEVIGGELLPALGESASSVGDLTREVQDLAKGGEDFSVGDFLGGIAGLSPTVNTAAAGVDKLRAAVEEASSTKLDVGLDEAVYDARVEGRIGKATADLSYLKDGADDAASSIDGLAQSIDDYLAGLFDVPSAQRELRQSFDDLKDANMEGTWDDQAVAMEQVVTRHAQMIQAMQEQEASQAELDAATYGTIAALAASRDQGEITGDMFDRITEQIKGVPSASVTETSAPGATEATVQVRTLEGQVRDVPRSWRSVFTADTGSAQTNIDALIAKIQRLNQTVAGMPSGGTGGGLGAKIGAITAGLPRETAPVVAESTLTGPITPLSETVGNRTTGGGRPVQLVVDRRVLAEVMVPAIDDLERATR